MIGPFPNANVDGAGFYVPFFATLFSPTTAQEPNAPQFATIALRPKGGQRGQSLIEVLRTETKKADPNLPLYFVGTPKDSFEVFTGGNTVLATMFSIFGIVAMLLASVGLYGVTSFSVNQRTQEFGVRMALGAAPGRILGMVLKQGFWQLGLGLGIGVLLSVLLALLFGSQIQNYLIGITALDPLTYLAVIGVLSVVSLIATLIPARRATRVDPMIALRAE
jgi:ABC-type antimicrobial peptide transport system permease subunit